MPKDAKAEIAEDSEVEIIYDVEGAAFETRISTLEAETSIVERAAPETKISILDVVVACTVAADTLMMTVLSSLEVCVS